MHNVSLNHTEVFVQDKHFFQHFILNANKKQTKFVLMKIKSFFSRQKIVFNFFISNAQKKQIFNENEKKNL